ncbi:MAG: adenine deaminase [Bacteroidales bacterium]|nr:adenine deaminase [Bacteroidales bacterium]
MKIQCLLVDPLQRSIAPTEMTIENGTIVDRKPIANSDSLPVVMPGFVDAHVHIESSMLTPSHYAEAALRHGVVAAVCDPHEIANVLGVEGVRYMLDDAKRFNEASSAQGFYFCFAVPSCVPATDKETSGATLDAATVDRLLEQSEFYALAEMMNVPGVLYGDPAVHAKVEAAKLAGKPIDGHAPGFHGDELRRYVEAGISTDHECNTLDEAEERIGLGMKVLIREGSAARNFDALAPLLNRNDDRVMFCADDAHPDYLIDRYIDDMVRRAIAEDYPLWNVLRAACVTPVKHYGIPSGLLQIDDPADFVIVDNLQDFNVKQVFLAGRPIAAVRASSNSVLPNNFHAAPITIDDVQLAAPAAPQALRIITVTDGALLTGCELLPPLMEDGYLVADPRRDIAKIVVYNRYTPAPPAVGFIKGLGLQRGAFGASIAHDSHNIVVAGVEDESIVAAVNEIVALKGGLVVADGEGDIESLPLPVAGLMSDEPVEQVCSQYERLNERCHQLGSSLRAPFMTLSFMALPVIPDLKMTDKGLFDVRKWDFVSVVDNADKV